MARIRTVKPAFFRHRQLFLSEQEAKLPLRVAFAGLWTCADREGRFKWEPEELKLDCLPYDDVDFSRVLDALSAGGFIVHYINGGKAYGNIPSFLEHQVVNIREAKSRLPEPPETHVHACASPAPSVHTPNGENIPLKLRLLVLERNPRCVRCGSDRDLTVDHIFPRSIGGTHALTNLRTLCRACNSARPAQGPALVEDLAKDGLSLADMKRMCTHVHAQGEGKGREREGNGCSAERPALPAVDPLVEGLRAEGIPVANAPEPIAPDPGPPMLLFLIKPSDHRAALWGPGADFVAERCEISRDRAKGIIGKWLKDSKDNAIRVFELLAECQLKEKFDPRSWVTACLQGDSTENAERKAADDKIYRNVL